MEHKVIITQKGKISEGKAPEIIHEELTAGMYEGIVLIKRNVKKFTPTGVFGAQGGLLSGIHGEVVSKGTPVIKGIVATGPKSEYGEVIEKGRTAGKTWPPEGVLVRWIEVKLGVDEKEAKRLEFVIRRKIGKKGFPGVHMFGRGLEASWPTLETIFDKRGFTIARKLNE